MNRFDSIINKSNKRKKENLFISSTIVEIVEIIQKEINDFIAQFNYFEQTLEKKRFSAIIDS